jgi:glycosyltransferase involved in cell wall biosynthesis
MHINKKNIQNLDIVTYGYPCNTNRIWYPFVQEFAHAVARAGVKTRVLAPLPIHFAWRSRDSEKYVENTARGGLVEVYRPRYLSLSSRGVGSWNTALVGREGFYRAARRVLNSTMVGRADAFYGHFLYLGGEAAVRLGQLYGVPSFPMVGEGLLNSMDPFGKVRGRKHFAAATAFMSNSSCLAQQLQRDLGVEGGQIGIFPNGVDHQRFYPRDKTAMRRKLGLPLDRFIVICVAKQDLQKGPIRVGEAIQGLGGVGGVFLGTGLNPPQTDNILVNHPAGHDQIPEWLSAADVFVLPTTWEGCCNAIIEAMACGLPVISSQGEFNDDILNEQVSIRVDPMDVAAIRQTIVYLRDNPARRLQMAESALDWSRRFDVGQRAHDMLKFMVEKLTST